MIAIVLASIAAFVFLYTISAIVISQQLGHLVRDSVQSPFIGGLITFLSGGVLILGALFLAIKILKARLTRL